MNMDHDVKMEGPALINAMDARLLQSGNAHMLPNYIKLEDRLEFF